MGNTYIYIYILYTNGGRSPLCTLTTNNNNDDNKIKTTISLIRIERCGVVQLMIDSITLFFAVDNRFSTNEPPTPPCGRANLIITSYNQKERVILFLLMFFLFLILFSIMIIIRIMYAVCNIEQKDNKKKTKKLDGWRKSQALCCYYIILLLCIYIYILRYTYTYYFARVNYRVIMCV